ncbi:MAG: SapC family protein [Alphaproteobacteria bacterium]
MSTDTVDNAAPSPAGEAGAAALPPLYSKPVLIDAQKHASLSLKENGGYAFARSANVMMVNAIEFAAAARHYPIVFAGGDNPAPVVVLGMRAGQNLFVEPDGSWRRGAYVPAYARRYPFIFAESPDKSKLGLCIDQDSDLLAESDVRPLFRNGERTPVLEQALAFSTAFQRELERTRAFTDALKSQGLLRDNRANIKMATGEQLSVTGFQVIDEAKFNALPDDIFLDWRRKGWLTLAYCHLLSTGSWVELIDQQADRSITEAGHAGAQMETDHAA